MRRRGLKPAVRVELFGVLMERMHEQRSDPGVLRKGHCAIDGILKQRCAQMLSLRPAVDREPAKHQDRNRIRQVAANAAGCQLVRNGACRHGVVATNPTVLIGNDKGAARPA